MNVHDDTTRCEWVRDSIDAYLDGELTNVGVTAMESHLEECSACREELESARQVLSELRGLPQQRCPDGVTDNLYEIIDAETTTQRVNRLPAWLTFRRFGMLRPALVGSLMLVVAVFAVWIGINNRSPGDSPGESPIYTPEEVAQAEAELKWTMAFLGDVGRRTGYAVRDDAVGARVVEPMLRAVQSAPGGGSDVTPHNNGG